MRFSKQERSALLAAASMQSYGRSTPASINVNVGQSGLTFMPNTIVAPVGSTVQFNFYPANHSVVQGNFDTPCQPAADAAFSGFVPTAVGLANTTFTLTVNDTEPMWIYCSQAKHCQAGMALVINPPSNTSQTLAAYISAAANATTLSPSVAPNKGILSAASNTTLATNSTSAVNGTATGTAASTGAASNGSVASSGAGASVSSAAAGASQSTTATATGEAGGRRWEGYGSAAALGAVLLAGVMSLL